MTVAKQSHGDFNVRYISPPPLNGPIQISDPVTWPQAWRTVLPQLLFKSTACQVRGVGLHSLGLSRSVLHPVKATASCLSFNQGSPSATAPTPWLLRPGSLEGLFPLCTIRKEQRWFPSKPLVVGGYFCFSKYWLGLQYTGSFYWQITPYDLPKQHTSSYTKSSICCITEKPRAMEILLLPTGIHKRNPMDRPYGCYY